MTVETLIKELMKLPNQQMPVFFEAGMTIVKGAAVKIDELSTEKVLTLEGDRQGVILRGKNDR